MKSLDPQKNEAFSHLFPCVMKMLDAITEVKDHPNRLYYAWAITKTIVRKVASVSHLLQPIPIPLNKQGDALSDPISVQVIVRSILEAYLIWEKIFIMPDDEDEKEFWYFAWALKSLRSRAEMELPLPDEELPQIDPKTGEKTTMKAKDAKENMKENVVKLQEELQKNAWYQAVMSSDAPGDFKRYLKRCTKGGWKTKPSELLQHSMPYHHSKGMYAFMSATAHLDHMDVKQTTKAQGHEEIIEYAELSLHVLLSVLARLCIHLPDVFPHLLPIAQTLPQKTVMWIAARELVTTGEAAKLSKVEQPKSLQPHNV